jgi:YD repeat-containing protein
MVDRIPQVPLFALLALAIGLACASPAAAGTTAYTYDALGRVATAVYPNGTTVVYHYDSAGNRTQSVQAPTSVWGGFTWGSGTWG